MPDAARAVLHAAHEDARRAGAGTRYAARLAATRLAHAGWHITPAHAPNGRHTPTQHAA